jgi:hypothetical protein
MGTINIAWWNLQNFFDTDDDPISKDFEYSAEAGWTQEVFEAKKANLAQALARWCRPGAAGRGGDRKRRAAGGAH